MLQRNKNKNTNVDKNINLNLSDRDRYYFKRTGSVDQSELIERNSMAMFIK